MVDNSFDVETFLRSIKATKPPWECPKCQKLYKSYIGIEYHLQNFDHTASTVTPNRLPTSSRKSKLKFSKRKKNNRFFRRSPSPVEFLSQTRETLTWAEAQRMVEVESEGKVYRLNIDEKLDIISDSDLDKDDDNVSESCKKVETENTTAFENKKASCKINSDVAANDASAINLKDLRNVSLRRGSYATENQTANLLSTPSRSSKLPKPSFRILPDYDKETADAPPRSSTYYRYIEKPSEEVEEEIEYDMDEEDTVWLELMNQKRAEDGLSDVTHDQLELLMDRFEKESYFDQAKLGSNGSQPPIDEDAVCCVCNDGECQNSNVILFCDMCNLAVHQECYGVPYIPEGQWLCRRCLQSPSCPVDCCLCPSRTGAFKQTDDGRWAHVVCALWIPEVTFGNTVFLEPIDGLKNVPSARWKLTCYICKQKNAGACIQCHRTNCYVAFHVTCAQQAGLYMEMEAVKQTGRNGVTITVKKEAFCEAHTPTDSPQRKKRFNGQKIFVQDDKKVGEKLKKSKRIISEKQHEAPKISLPYIPRDKISSIGRRVTIQKKAMFLQRLLSYWTLKRQSRNGVPLLRRLQALVHQHRPNDPAKTSEQHQLIEQLKYWHRLRHDLERARLLIELIRKRERLKRDTVRILQAASELRLTPFALILRRLLSKLQSIDVAQVFAEPVDEDEAPDYYTFIKNPMDFATMAAKIDNQTYRSFSEFEDDFNLVVNNCIHYNERDTIFYRLAVRMRDVGGAHVRSTKREVQSTGLDLEAGLLLPTAPTQKTDAAITDDSRINDFPLREQLEIWQERLDEAVLNSRKTTKIKSEILSINKKIQEEEARKKFQNNTVPHRHRITTRRFSADDVGPSVAGAESEAVVSDVDSNFKISPKIRPVSFKPNGTARKRLWSAKASIGAWEPTPKKSTSQEHDGSPVKENIEKTDDSVLSDPGPLSPDPGVASESPVSDFSLNLNISSPTENSFPNSTSVNRRTSVLFRKKSRRRPSKSSDSAPNTPSDPGTSKMSKLNLLSSPDVTTDTDDDVAKPTVTEKETDGLYINGYSTSQDENVFNEKSSPKSGESDNMFREQSTRSSSQAESVSSDEGNRLPVSRKKRSYSCIITPTKHSNQSNSSTSFDEKSGFFTEDNADFPFEYLRRQSYVSTTEEDTDEEDLPVIAPLDLVWAKCRGYPHYPALLIDPKMPRSGFCHNNVPIPVPPMDVLQIGDKRIENGNRRIYLVLFFDSKRTWQWLPRDKLEKLGVDPESDRMKLAEGRRPAVRRNVEAAFKRALHHRSKVNGEIPDSDDEVAPSSVNEDRDDEVV